MKMPEKEGMNRSWNRASPTRCVLAKQRHSLTLTRCPSDDDVRGGKRHICVALSRDPIDSTFTSDSYKLKFLELEDTGSMQRLFQPQPRYSFFCSATSIETTMITITTKSNPTTRSVRFAETSQLILSPNVNRNRSWYLAEDEDQFKRETSQHAKQLRTALAGVRSGK